MIINEYIAILFINESLKKDHRFPKILSSTNVCNIDKKITTLK